MRVVPKPNHLSPFECGVFAGRSQVGKLILFHLYDNIPQDEALNEIRKNFEGEVIFPKDLQIIDAWMKEEYRGSKEHAYHISCGGIVFRENNRSLEVLLLHRRKSSDWEYDSWHLPKGTQYKDESEEDAAKREILEETGYEVEVLEKVGSLLSSYQLDGVTINKKTSYFICKALRNVGSGVKEHDEVRWVAIDRAIELVSQFLPFEKKEDILVQFKKAYAGKNTKRS